MNCKMPILSAALLLPLTAFAQGPTWTWVHGSDSVDHDGHYSAPGVADPANMPAAKGYAFQWTGKDGKLWLYGGLHYDNATQRSGCDLWRYDPAANIWTLIKGGNSSVVQPPVYGTKGVGSPLNTPGNRQNGASWTDTAGNLWLYGGIFDEYVSPTVFSFVSYGDLWKYNPGSNEWTWMGGDSSTGNFSYFEPVYGTKGVPDVTSRPGSRLTPVHWTDKQGSFWMWGGRMRSDLWKYNPNTGQWTWMHGDSTKWTYRYGTRGVFSSSNVPPEKDHNATWVDAGNKVWVYGGYHMDSNTSTKTADMWQYDPVLNQWAWISGDTMTEVAGVYSGNNRHPGSRTGSISWTSPSGDLYLYSGGRDYYPADDLWKYDRLQDKWTWISGDSTPYSPRVGMLNISSATNTPGVRARSACWTNASGTVWLFGGYSYQDDPSNQGVFNDMWRYNPGSTGVAGSPDATGGLTIVPNPFRSGFEIRFQGTTPLRVDLQLYDMLGKQLRSETVAVSNGRLQVSGLEELPTGYYQLRLNEPDGDGHWQTKLLKQ